MEEKKAESIFNLTDDIHNEVDTLYESMMEGDFDDSVKQIDNIIRKLKEIKSNLTIKDEV